MVQVKHVQRFLCQKLGVQDADAFRLHVALPNKKAALLSPESTLYEMVQKHHQHSSTIDLDLLYDLFYRYVAVV